VYDGATLTVPQLVSVGGSLEVNQDGILVAPMLTSVGDNLYVHKRATLDAVHLTSVSGDLVAHKGATLTTPRLILVNGYLYVYEGVTLDAVHLTFAYGQPGREIARCPVDGYVLWLTRNGLYYAGCRRGLTRDAALAHWSGDTERAKLFTAAILSV
jgi:hypothetical protein